MSKNKQAAIWATIALLMLIIGITTFESQRPRRRPKPVVAKAQVQPVQATTSPVVIVTAPGNDPALITTSTQAATSSPITTRPPSYKPKKPKPSAQSVLGYGETVSLYANTRIQFDSSCQAYPSRLAMANSVIFMFDNRSNTPQKITVAGKAYVVAPFNYVLTKLSEKILPATLGIACNGQYNTAVIILE